MIENIVQFRWQGKIILQNTINWKFAEGDVFQFWCGLNKVVSVNNVLCNSDEGLVMTQIVHVEPVDWDPLILWNNLD